MKPRHALLAVALVVTLAAVWLTTSRQGGDVDVPELAPRHAARVATAPAASNDVAAAQSTARFIAGGPDLFPAQSWKPPPKPVVVAPPPTEPVLPPPPQAPPLPFKYVGRWNAGDGDAIFLAQGEQMFRVRVGQNVAQWHLDSVDAGGMTFTYLPLQQQRQLRFSP